MVVAFTKATEAAEGEGAAIAGTEAISALVARRWQQEGWQKQL